MKVLALGIAVVCLVVAILYWIGMLQIGTSEPGPHIKHAAVFFVIGALSMMWFRFQSVRS